MDDQVGTDNETRVPTLDVKHLTTSSGRVLDFTLGFQKALLDEMAQASDEAIQRMRTEIEIGSEFVSRIASAHSVHEIAEACSECSQHQAEAIRQDSQLMFKHSQRIFERASQLFPHEEANS